MVQTIGDSLRILRKREKLTQAEMLDRLGFPRTTWASYESGKAELGPSELIKVSDFFGVSIDDIVRGRVGIGNLNEKSDSENLVTKGNLTGNLTGNLSVGKQPASGKSPRIKELQKLMDDTKQNFGKTGCNNVYRLQGRAGAGQAIELIQKDKERREPDLFLPDLGPGLHIQLQTDRDSMFPVIKPGDKPVSTWLPDIKNLHSGDVYLVIDANDGAVYKRVYRKGAHHLKLASDNEIYKPYDVHLEDVLALFLVQEVHSSDLRPYWADIRRDMAELKAEMEDIRGILGTNRKAS